MYNKYKYFYIWEVDVLDDTKTRIIFAAMKAVRQYGLEEVRIQNVSKLAGISPGALYRYHRNSCGRSEDSGSNIMPAKQLGLVKVKNPIRVLGGVDTGIFV